MKSIEQTITDVKLAELHVKPLAEWSNEEWHFFAENNRRVIELVKCGYMDDFLPKKQKKLRYTITFLLIYIQWR